jgi:hypothetical protein
LYKPQVNDLGDNPLGEELATSVTSVKSTGGDQAAVLQAVTKGQAPVAKSKKKVISF